MQEPCSSPALPLQTVPTGGGGLRPGDEPVEVCCVLNGDWPTGRPDNLGLHYVRTLYTSLIQYAPHNLQWRFTCLSDRMIPNISCVPLPTKLWTWFSKLYLFSPNVFPTGSKVLYFDLDTVITGEWGALARAPTERMVCLGDWMPGTQQKLAVPASGIMLWRTTPDTQRIWNEFEPQSNMRPPYSHPAGILPKAIRTDEHWLYQFLMPNKWISWNELIPGKLASYKNQIARAAMPFDLGDIRVIYMHGRPRPHEICAPWNPYWRN